ncbi:MAG: NADH:ubiquinone reductase (Na(+)-transporting) subunit C [Chlamydiia bacterium]|nr:NADH:ubiquinone reductase (Na(+)-transporting) subunit C [Chlamydiia bacterium]
MEGGALHSNRYIVFFIIAICFSCALILSVLSSTLEAPQEKARKLYLSRQLLISADLLKPASKLSDTQILDLYQTRVEARLTNQAGDLYTFEKAGLDMATYLRENAKTGYAKLPNKLVYVIKQLHSEQIYGYVIPINGYGLWDAIYGFLCIAPNGDTVIGTTWYEQAETPGLGGEIATPKWQAQFPGKLIFRQNPDGSTNYQAAPLGIVVVKTTVAQELDSKPAAKSAVDGIAGATKTSEGVTEAYKKSLAPYRQFLIRAKSREAA